MSDESIAEFVSRGQLFRCVGTEPYVNKGGVTVDLLLLETVCPDCGGLAIIKTSHCPLDIGRLSRRCANCRKPGVKVWPTRAKTADAAHKAFLAIDEYRAAIAPDQQGAE